MLPAGGGAAGLSDWHESFTDLPTQIASSGTWHSTNDAAAPNKHDHRNDGARGGPPARASVPVPRHAPPTP